jgi:hypothetical protein
MEANALAAKRTPVDLVAGVVLFAWLYGVPFLLLVGLIRRTSSAHVSTVEQADQFAAVTDRFLIWGLALNLAIPAVGLLLAAAIRQWHVIRRFGWMVLAAFGLYLVIGMVGSVATGPLIGHRPVSDQPAPEAPQHCVPRSGGHGCPGG